MSSPLLPAAARQVISNINDLQKNPIEGITVRSTDDLQVLEAEIKGPADTPFEGGLFNVRLIFDSGYPAVPPKGYFTTKVFHPNVSDPKGEICVNTLKRDWDPKKSLRDILTVIRCLLIEPNPESALNEEAGKMLLENYAEYCKRAALLTSIHAAPAVARSDKENDRIEGVAQKDGEKKSGTPLAQKAINKERKKTLKRL